MAVLLGVWLVFVAGVTAGAPSVVEITKTSRNNQCGGWAYLKPGEYTYFTSLHFSNPYPSPGNCVWDFSSPANTVLRLTCPYFRIRKTTRCLVDSFMATYTSQGWNGPFRYYCGNQDGRVDFITDSNLLKVNFSASYNYNDLYTGFYCTVTPLHQEKPYDSCGVKGSSRIVGGQNAAENEWSWQVAIRIISSGIIICGGVLISQQWVLTTAYCAEYTTGIYVSVGFITLDNAKFIQHRQVVEIIVHEHFNAITVDNDIALLRLDRPVSYSVSVRPVCLLCFTYNLSGKTGTVTGWGDTTGEGNTSPVLKKVVLPILTTSECQWYLHGNVTNNMICTYSPGQDACQGDSGGPLTLAINQFYYLVGLVSFGFGCAEVNSPGVYTKVTVYINWINQKTSLNHCS